MTPRQLAEEVDLCHGIFTPEEREQVLQEITEAIQKALAQERKVYIDIELIKVMAEGTGPFCCKPLAENIIRMIQEKQNES